MTWMPPNMRSDRSFEYLPRAVRALRFHGPEPLGVADWPALLEQTDRARLTLALGIRRREWLPAGVRGRIERDLTNNAERYRRFTDVRGQIADALMARRVPFLFLKGNTHFPYFCDDLLDRPQYDIDLFCPPAAIHEARCALEELGFEAAARPDRRADHLPPMIRRAPWQWHGDYFDPNLPPSIELHFRFWDASTEGFDVAGLAEFWNRRAGSALGLPDRLSYAALHALRHLLRGDLRLYHIYEIAYFLERSAGDDDFWQAWRHITAEPFRQIQAIPFRLASDWFGCRLQAAAQEALNGLPAPIVRWFDLFGAIPGGQSNKDELLLHLCLVRGAATRARIAARRLLPMRGRPQRAATRAGHHAWALLHFTRSALRWWTIRTRTPRGDIVPG